MRRLPPGTLERSSALVEREWLVTNGIGGYASGSVAGAPTRKYHGLLVAALPNPLGRTVMLSHLEESVETPGRRPVRLDIEDGPGEPPAPRARLRWWTSD